MGTKRKQSKPDTDDLPAQDDPSSQSVRLGGAQQRHADTSQKVTAHLNEATSSRSAPSARPSNWMPSGSWRSKASPVAQIAHENISVAKGATSEALEEGSQRPSQSLSKGMRGSRKSIPLVAEATRVHATSDAERDKSRPAFPSEEKLKGIDTDTNDEPKAVEDAPLPPEPTVHGADNDDASSMRSNNKPQPAWFGWWSRPEGYGSDGENLNKDKERQNQEVGDPSDTPLPGTPVLETSDVQREPDNETKAKGTSVEGPSASAAQWEGIQTNLDSNATPSRSWFNIWSSAQNQQTQNDGTKGEETQARPAAEVTTPAESRAPEDTMMSGGPRKSDAKAKSTEDRTKSSGWAFWSSDKAGKSPDSLGEPDQQVGELAVADTPSQSHPEVAQFNKQRDNAAKVAVENVAQGGPASKRVLAEKSKVGATASPSTTGDTVQNESPILPEESIPQGEAAVPAPVQRGKKPQSRPNLILPTFDDTYPIVSRPGYLERLTHYLTQSLHLPGARLPLSSVHVNKTQSVPKVRRAIAIGVHGFFPAPLIQKVLGQPTGTSIRFANYAAASIKAWCEEHQPDVKDVEIEKVALEGEGYITDRVSTLWKLLLNWLSHLRQADFVFVACHSQGVPVATMLVAKLIQLGCLSSHVKIGVCAMAGINLGPFQEYKSRLFGGTALELFEFADPNSKVSKSHAESLDICLRHGVRMTFIGSMDDQLVSLESSLFAPLSHPYVCRAIFIDGRLHAPNFLTHLVVFALKLRNLGISDHNLIRELSAPLAGSLVGGDGHSRVYDDPAVYNLALDFALESTDITMPTSTASPATAADRLLASDKTRAREKAAARRASLSGYPSTPSMANRVRRGSVSATTSLPGIAPIIAHHEPLPPSSTPANPFYLPWAVRGMLEEDIVKRDPTMWAEVEQLVQEFEEWRPTSKVLKDVRWRLEGVRSML